MSVVAAAASVPSRTAPWSMTQALSGPLTLNCSTPPSSPASPGLAPSRSPMPLNSAGALASFFAAGAAAGAAAAGAAAGAAPPPNLPAAMASLRAASRSIFCMNDSFCEAITLPLIFSLPPLNSAIGLALPDAIAR